MKITSIPTYDMLELLAKHEAELTLIENDTGYVIFEYGDRQYLQQAGELSFIVYQ